MKTGHLVSRRLQLEELESRWVPSSPSTSTNWSGYAITPSTGQVTAVYGSWTVPTVTGSGATYSSAWVGIDGYSSNSVEQTGTEMDVINGQAEYSAWYEMYPNAEVTIGSVAVKAGDKMSASVTYSAGVFKLTITDTTNGESFTTNQSDTSPAAARSSAEWIDEAPSVNGRIATLANFGTVSFTNAYATVNNTTGAIDNSAWASSVYQINMINRSGTTIATTGTLADSSNMSSFSVAFGSTAPGNPTPPSPPTPPSSPPTPPTPPPPPTTSIATTTTLTGSVNPYSWYPSVTFTATVSPAVPLGSTVDLVYNNQIVAAGTVHMVHGVEEVQWTVNFYARGSYTFTAVFVGSGNYLPSLSNSLTVTVS